MGHLQPATIVITDNPTADGIVNGCVKQQRTRAMDMRFYWIKESKSAEKVETQTPEPFRSGVKPQAQRRK
eukprot:14434869-Ditylum_brightwellii.AAC.1